MPDPYTIEDAERDLPVLASWGPASDSRRRERRLLALLRSQAAEIERLREWNAQAKELLGASDADAAKWERVARVWERRACARCRKVASTCDECRAQAEAEKETGE